MVSVDVKHHVYLLTKAAFSAAWENPNFYVHGIPPQVERGVTEQEAGIMTQNELENGQGQDPQCNKPVIKWVTVPWP